MTLEEAMDVLRQAKAADGAWDQTVTTTDGETFTVAISVFDTPVAYIRSPHEWHRRRSELLARFPRDVLKP